MPEPTPPNSPNRPNKFMDIVHAGDFPPNATSKPIVINNPPNQPDPMFARPTQDHPASLQNPAQGSSVPKAENDPAQELPADLNPSDITPTKPAKQSHRRIKIILPLIFGIVLIFVVADLLVDANIVHTSVTPLTNFFHHH